MTNVGVDLSTLDGWALYLLDQLNTLMRPPLEGFTYRPQKTLHQALTVCSSKGHRKGARVIVLTKLVMSRIPWHTFHRACREHGIEMLDYEGFLDQVNQLDPHWLARYDALTQRLVALLDAHLLAVSAASA